MRVLLTNNHLRQPGGSETWTRAMARALSGEHDVTVLTRDKGPFAEGFECPVVEKLESRFDVALVNHNTCLHESICHSDRTVFTCHGIVPKLEQPLAGADVYVSVSEEVRDHLSRLGYESSIIRNGVDCSEFRPHNKIAPRIKRLLSACQGKHAIDVLEHVCRLRRIEFDYIHQDRMTNDVAGRMNWADVVVGLGRTAYEAMACGRAVLVMDSRGYMPPAMEGFVTESSLPELLKFNLSGRRYRVPIEPRIVDHVLDSYTANMGEFNRRFAEAHANIKATSRAYLRLASGTKRGQN